MTSLPTKIVVTKICNKKIIIIFNINLIWHDFEW